MGISLGSRGREHGDLCGISLGLGFGVQGLEMVRFPQIGRNKMALFFGHMPWKETTVTKWRCFSDSIACEVASNKSAVTKWRCFLGTCPGKKRP